ncbi:GNAT family N-acetyltransferase [Streptomyces sp. CAU 1734]|uniref:GNAT family N-acetyltransferase n=1 Tax=Streptomyces sp. CAU 1734 TaxID=3140360 RepID=UPI00326080BB
MIDYGYTDRAGRRVVLREIGDENWRAVADVVPLDDQRAHVPPSAARYLLLSSREDVWNSLAVEAGGTVVGHVMWAREEESGSYWIGGMLIDGAEQGAGAGRAAVRSLVRWLAGRADCETIRLSYAPENTAAGRLYTSLGFRDSGVVEDGEVVALLAAREVAADGSPASA